MAETSLENQMKKSISSVKYLIVLAWLVAATTQPQAQELSKLPYVPTPQIVVDEMLKLANVTAKDFVVDLGSGDGRMILTAAKTFKASGFGVDIDPKLVELSNQEAKSQGLAERAKFFEQDMFKADLSKATVVTLYVLPDFMERLRPKLLAEMKPGTRIVAHDYYMSDWYPDRQATLTVPEKEKANGTDKAYLYLWTVPAVVLGHWRMDLDVGDGKPQLIVLSFNQKYQMINAAAETRAGPLSVDKPLLKGDELEFSLTLGATNYRFTGRVLGDKVEGTAISTPSGKPITWRANKLPPDKK